MQPEVSLPDAARQGQLIAEILAVTPVDPDGLVVSHFDEDGKPHCRQMGENIAREQAIAAMRWAARHVECDRDARWLLIAARELEFPARPSNTEETTTA